MLVLSILWHLLTYFQNFFTARISWQCQTRQNVGFPTTPRTCCRTTLRNVKKLLYPVKCQTACSLTSMAADNRFSNFFTVRQSIKCPARALWYFPPHLTCVATLPWEMQNSNSHKTSTNIARFSWFFHHCNQHATPNKALVTFPTTP